MSVAPLAQHHHDNHLFHNHPRPSKHQQVNPRPLPPTQQQHALTSSSPIPPPPPLITTDTTASRHHHHHHNHHHHYPSSPHSRHSSRSASATAAPHSASVSSRDSSVFDLERGTWIDLEKHAALAAAATAGAAAATPSSPRLSHVVRPAVETRMVVYTDDEGAADRDALNGRALGILFYLSAPCALVSLVFAFVAMATFFLGLILMPLRLCNSAMGHRPYLILQSLLRTHLRLVYALPDSTTMANWQYFQLAVVLLLSPVVSLFVVLAAWTAGIFWIFTAIIGNPDGDDRYNDGRAAVLWTRNRWERWLLHASR